MEDDDNFIKGAKKTRKIDVIEQHNFTVCSDSLKSYFSNIKSVTTKFKVTDISGLINTSFSGESEKKFIRPTLWKIALSFFTKNDSLEDWMSSTKIHRDNYKLKTKEYTSLKTFVSDPLGGQNSEWNTFFEDTEMRKLIVKDVNRTYQEKDLFKNNAIKEMLTTILFIWSKENKSYGYWQGMNEILALVMLSIHPFYHSAKNRKIQSEFSWDDIYSYLHDLDELAADTYQLFSLLMARGVADLYCKVPVKDYKINNLEGIVFAISGKDLGAVNPKHDFLKLRIESVTDYYLKEICESLYNHFQKVEFDCHMILLRWYRCLFNREFHSSDCLKLLDAIIATDYISIELDEVSNLANNKIKEEPKRRLALIEYLICAMMMYLKEDLLVKDSTDCYARLNKFPPIESVNIFITLSVELKAAFEENLERRFIKEKEKQIEKEKEKEKSNSFKFQHPLNKDSKDLKVIKEKSKEIDTKSKDLKEPETSKISTNTDNEQVALSDSAFLSSLVEKYISTFNEEEKIRLKSIINKMEK